MCSSRQAYKVGTTAAFVLSTGKQNNPNPRQGELRHSPEATRLVEEAGIKFRLSDWAALTEPVQQTTVFQMTGVAEKLHDVNKYCFMDKKSPRSKAQENKRTKRRDKKKCRHCACLIPTAGKPHPVPAGRWDWHRGGHSSEGTHRWVTPAQSQSQGNLTNSRTTFQTTSSLSRKDSEGQTLSFILTRRDTA